MGKEQMGMNKRHYFYFCLVLQSYVANLFCFVCCGDQSCYLMLYIPAFFSQFNFAF